MSYKDIKKQREYQRLWMHKRRMDFFEGKSCVQCGSTENLELDHIDRTTKIDHKIWSWTRVKREAEIAKCQVLCHDCHKEKTRAENREIAKTQLRDKATNRFIAG